MKSHYNILICPLDWGLGHASRMIPVARILRDMDNTIYIGAGEDHQALYRKELTGLSYIKFPGFRAEYSHYMPQYVSLLLKIPVLLFHIIAEHFRLKEIIKKYNIDIVISDNRFGLWNRKVTTVYVTHQITIPFPKAFRFLEIIGILLHRAIIKKYTLCFIPDLPGDINLTGRLSHGRNIPENVRYTGILSRFICDSISDHGKQKKIPHTTVILSGPEPQKEILKQKLICILKDKEPPAIILEGKPGKTNEPTDCGNITFYNHLSASEMKEIIMDSDKIITRSGYSTIMDLISLNCSALLIPTPGQTEQEYLAEYLSEKGLFSAISQKSLTHDIHIPANKTSCSDFILKQSILLLPKAVNELLEIHHKKIQSKKSG